MVIKGAKFHITGVVQGVGFRPFVYGLAQRLNLTGWVQNTSAGVDIEVDGSPYALKSFAEALQSEAPALARLDTIQVEQRPPNGFTDFQIIHSAPIPGGFQPISPDVTVCHDCLHELFDPADRRYRYPFINCTNCGPRFTIINDIPYDRPLTTMARFEMCSDCAAEYENPLDRRFHAQPVACPACGPRVWLEYGDQLAWDIDQWSDNERQRLFGDGVIGAARELLRLGHIVAIKGLGGFHLACDATNPEAVAELRQRKLRVDKPFAVMISDLDSAKRHCLIDESELSLLSSRGRPIVVLKRRPDSTIDANVAPGQSTIGVMLPYTPLHYLLLESASGFPNVLVMTSGNLSEEPIATRNEEARQRLSPLADAFLFHDRDIRTRCDDSVARIFYTQEKSFTEDSSNRGAINRDIYMLRRSRGYAPDPVQLPWLAPPLLAAGAELKNTFCLTNGRYAFLSHHIGDMENYETLRAFEDGVTHFERLFRVFPEALVYDLHPNYLATRYALNRAREESLPAIGVQHHHAHVAACMAENGLDGSRPVIGVSFDGTGYGDDGAIWGGEFLVADYDGYKRPYHLEYIPLPGGDKAVKEPWRLALAWLLQAGIDWEIDMPPVQYASHLEYPVSQPLDVIRHQIETGLNSPATSSMGRLFDAISALAGVRQVVNYEAQAAIELEALVDPLESGFYPFKVKDGHIEATPLIRAVVKDVHSGTKTPTIAARFHNGVAHMVADTCDQIRDAYGQNKIVLSGGVWQNMTLLDRTVALLQQQDFIVYLHRQVPANDGGLALGQVAVAAWRLANGE